MRRWILYSGDAEQGLHGLLTFVPAKVGRIVYSHLFVTYPRKLSWDVGKEFSGFIA